MNQIRTKDLNLGQSLFEIRETIRTLAGLISGVVNLAKALRGHWGSLNDLQRSWLLNRPLGSMHPMAVYYRHVIADDLRRRGRMLNQRAYSLADAYLGFMFGVRPLMADIYALLHDLRDRADSPLLYCEVEVDDPYHGLPTDSTSAKRYSGSSRLGVLTGVHIVLDDPSLFNAWSYGLTDPLGLAWELTPLSLS